MNVFILYENILDNSHKLCIYTNFNLALGHWFLNICFTNPPTSTETRWREIKSTFILFIIIFLNTVQIRLPYNLIQDGNRSVSLRNYQVNNVELVLTCHHLGLG